MKKILAFSLLLLTAVCFADNQELAKEIPHLAAPQANLYTAGQPSNKAWQLLAKEGVTTVINLRSDEEMAGSGEAQLVEENGMQYIHIPVAGAGDISFEKAQLLQQAMAGVEGKVLVHCASSNRVGALLALNAAQNSSVDEAIAVGKKAGLTSLQPVVEKVLNNK